MSKTEPVTVTEYIDAAPQEARSHLLEIRSILKEVAPDATETLKWGKPVLEQGRILFSYAAERMMRGGCIEGVRFEASAIVNGLTMRVGATDLEVRNRRVRGPARRYLPCRGRKAVPAFST